MEVNKPKVRLDLYKDQEKQVKFLLHIALTFRLLPDTLANLFQMPVEKINEMLFYGGSSHMGLNYLIEHEFPDQELATAKFLKFYTDLLDAIKVKDKEKMTELLNYLYDVKAIKIARTRESGDPLSEDDIETIVLYQLKYGLSQVAILKVFNISRRGFQPRLVKFLEQNPELRRRYEYFADFILAGGGRK